MKLSILNSLYLISILLCFSFVTNATTYTWSGRTNTTWYNSGNWSPTGIPGTGDNVIIVSATNNLIMDSSKTITAFTITSGILNLGTKTLSCTGAVSASAGTIQNGTLKPRGASAIFSGANFNCRIEANCGSINLSGGTFNSVCILVDSSAAQSTGDGGCVFNDSLTIQHTGSGQKFYLAKMTGDTYNGPVSIVNSSNQPIKMADAGNNYFNNSLKLGSENTGGITIGAGGGRSELDTSMKISIESSGFRLGNLELNRFVQLSNTLQNLSLIDSANISLDSCVFNGPFSLSAKGFLLKSCTFQESASFTKNGWQNYQSSGGNTFNGETTFNNIGTAGEIRLASTSPDNYNGNVTFYNTGGLFSTSNTIRVAYNGINVFKNDITNNGTYIFYNSSTGTVKLSGTIDQNLNGSTAYSFRKIVIDKNSGNVNANISLIVEDSLVLTLGKLVTTSTNLLTMNAGSKAVGASDSSFVSGPIKKIGNSSFVFPVGKSNLIQPLTIEAPALSTESFTCEYFNIEQQVGFSRDSTLDFISRCNYWELIRNTGSSNVKVTLSWKNECTLLDSLDARIASWDGSKWKDIGYGIFSGSKNQGSLTSASSTNSFSYFALGYNMSSTSYLPRLGLCMSYASGANILCSDSPGNVNYGNYCEGLSFDFNLDAYTVNFINGLYSNPTLYCLQWSLPGSNCSNPTSCGNYSGTVTCGYASAGNYSISAQIIYLGTGLPVLYGGGSGYTMNILSTPNPTITGTLSLCNQSSTTLNAGSGYSTYLWSTGATTQNINVITGGTYTVTVTGSNGCHGSTSVNVVGNYYAISITNSVPNICFGNHNGSLTANITSGIPISPVTYLWQTGVATVGTTSTINNLSPAVYNVTVTDASGCSHTASATISYFPVMTLTMDHLDATSCVTSINGSASVSVSGGTTPYTYLWSNSATTSTINNVVGTYTVTVTDANGCTKVDEVIVSLFDPIEPTILGPTSNCALSTSYVYTITNTTNFPVNTVFSWIVIDGATSNFPGTTLDLTSTPPSLGATIQAIATNNGCIGESAIITIQGCCDNTSTFTEINDGNLSDFLTSYNGGAPLFNGLSNVGGIGPDIIFNGTFTWNNVLGIPRFINCNLIFGPGARILNNSGEPMRFEACTFESCAELWQGIELLTSSDIRLVDCIVEDAYYAIWQRKPCTMNLTDVTFDNNYIGVKYGSFGSIGAYPITSLLPGHYTRVKFHSTSLLKGAYPGLFPDPTIPGNHAYAGIYSQFVQGFDLNNDVEFGDPTASSTNRLNMGIYMQYGSLSISDNVHFGNIIREAAYGVGAPNGCAIYALGNPREYPGSLTVIGSIGSPSWDNTTFRNCDRAVHSELMDHNVIANVMTNDVDRGVFINTGFFDVNIVDNLFNVNRTGIQLSNCSASTVPLNDPFDITDASTHAISMIGNTSMSIGNNATTFNDAVGIRIWEPNDLAPTEAYLELNQVDMGIGLQAFHFVNNRFIGCKWNSATLNSTNQSFGFLVQRSFGVVNLCSGVNSMSTFFGSNILHFGYFNSMTRAQIIQHGAAENMWRGFHFNGNCTPHFNIENYIDNASNCGYFLSPTGNTGIQDVFGNIWSDPATTFPALRAAFNSNSTSYLTSCVRVSPNNMTYGSYYFYPNYDHPFQEYTSPGQQIWFFDYPLVDNHLDFTECSVETALKLESNLDSLIVLDSAISSEFVIETGYMARYNLYNDLKINEELRDTNSFFADFFADMDSCNIPDFSDIDFQIKDIDIAFAEYLNSVRMDRNNLDSLIKLMNYNDSLLNTDSISSIDSLNLQIENDTISNLWNEINSELTDKNAIYYDNRFNELDALIEDVSAIDPDNLIEENKQFVTLLYLNTIAKDIYNFTSLENELLFAIASQCPDQGGEVVYDARMLYSFIDEETNFDDFLICEGSSAYRSSNQNSNAIIHIKDFMQINPNPAKSLININYKIETDGKLFIRNLEGKIVKELQISKENQEITIDLSYCKSGLYNVEMLTESNLLRKQITLINE